MSHKILVVEDDQPILELMDLLIRKLGYEPVLIANGVEALESVTADHPSVILLDIMMAPINGWEFLERIRANPSTREIPVIIFSATPQLEEKVAELNDPKLSILQKPVKFTDLKAGIERVISK